jgi:DNA-binding NarL/FixJ family response regulator
VTTSSRIEDIQDMYAAGANTYLKKPQDFDRLVDVLRAVGYY